MGPCAFCGVPAPFGFDAHLAGLRSKGRIIWACATHRAGLPEKGQGGHEMDELQEFEDDEHEDLTAAAGAMALHWKAQGLGEQVAAIGREQGIEGARVLLGTWFALRAHRQNAETKEARDAIPY
jgi:hypothetical protein